VAFLLADLGVTKTHSRPHVSDDNPYSESQFRTMNIGRSSRTASGVFRTAARSARDFSVGTTMNTATPAWRCSRRRWFTTDRVRSSSNSAKPCSTELIQTHPETLCPADTTTSRGSDRSLDQQTAKLRKQNSITLRGCVSGSLTRAERSQPQWEDKGRNYEEIIRLLTDSKGSIKARRNNRRTRTRPCAPSIERSRW